MADPTCLGLCPTLHRDMPACSPEYYRFASCSYTGCLHVDQTFQTPNSLFNTYAWPLTAIERLKHTNTVSQGEVQFPFFRSLWWPWVPIFVSYKGFWNLINIRECYLNPFGVITSGLYLLWKTPSIGCLTCNKMSTVRQLHLSIVCHVFTYKIRP